MLLNNDNYLQRVLHFALSGPTVAYNCPLPSAINDQNLSSNERVIKRRKLYRSYKSVLYELTSATNAFDPQVHTSGQKY